MSERDAPLVCVVVEDAGAVAAEAERRVLAALGDAGDGARLVLAGGSTPRALYRRLARDPQRLDWRRVLFFWGDERCVPPDSDDSNARMAREALLDPLGVAPERVHRVRGELPPERAAAAYDELLRAAAPPRADGTRFDLVLLGLGADGHTASLFPRGPELAARDRLAVASRAPSPPHDRVSLTPEALSAARHVLFLVTGAGKADAVARVVAGDPELPARRVRPPAGEVVWLLDRAAASRVGWE